MRIFTAFLIGFVTVCAYSLGAFLGGTYTAGSIDHFLFAAAFLIFGLLLHTQQVGRAETRMKNLAKLLKRSGIGGDAQSVEEQVRSLVWQTTSCQKVGGDLSELINFLREDTSRIRKNGPSALKLLPSRIMEITRASCVVLLHEPNPGFVVQESMGRSLPSTILRPLASRMCETLTPLRARIFQVDELYLALGDVWQEIHAVISSYAIIPKPSVQQPEECEDPPQGKLYLLLGYEHGVTPLPREEEIAAECLQLIARALREFAAVSEVSTQAQEEKQRQEKYFAHISHDIRTPLNNIQAILDLFFLEGVTEENKQFLQVARANCRSLRDIVEELLEFTKYKDGKLQPQQELLQVEDIVAGVINEFSLNAEVKGLALSYHCLTEKGVQIDRKHLKRILMNLVSNGLKYTEHGGVTVIVFEKENQLIIEVRDSGVGITPENLQSLFVPFTRIGEVKVEGIGLGLTLTKLLVEANGGRVEVRSVHGNGSTFAIHFPAVVVERRTPRESGSKRKPLTQKRVPKATRPSANTKPPVLTKPRFDFGGEDYRVLIIDDDVSSGQTLAKLLRRFELQVQSIHRVYDLRGLINFWKPHLIISDVQMPDGGIEKVVEIVRECGDIPIIALTGCVDKGELSHLEQLALSHVLRKPVQPNELLQAIEKCSHGSPRNNSQNEVSTPLGMRNQSERNLLNEEALTEHQSHPQEGAEALDAVAYHHARQ